MSNKKWTKENGVLIVDSLAENPNLTQAAKLVGGGQKLIFHWMKASSVDEAAGIAPENAEHGIQWPDEEWIYFHRAVIQSQKRFLAVAQSQVRSLLASPESGGGGHERIVTGADGKPAWLVDPLIASHAMTMNDDEWELSYGQNRKRSDVYARDERGALIPWKVRDPIPSQTLIHLIRSLFPDMFNPSQNTQADVHHSGAVLVLGDQAPETKAAATISPLRQDLEARLAEIRARGGNKPDAPVAVFRDMRSIDQPDDTPRAAPAQPKRLPAPRPSGPPQDYGRPATPLDGGGRGRGVIPSGGMKIS
jgi:hypothetical protein